MCPKTSKKSVCTVPTFQILNETTPVKIDQGRRGGGGELYEPAQYPPEAQGDDRRGYGVGHRQLGLLELLLEKLGLPRHVNVLVLIYLPDDNVIGGIVPGDEAQKHHDAKCGDNPDLRHTVEAGHDEPTPQLHEDKPL
jgi:hypothetical protein